MKIGIIGSGMIGGTAARLFVKAGHEVAISNSRGPQSLAGLVQEVGPQLKATTVEEAADFGEVVLVAIPLKDYKTLPATQLKGKIVVDSMNYYPQRDGDLHLNGRSSSEMVAETLPEARVVKAFNTMWYKTLGEEGKPGAKLEDRLVLFVAGDDLAAKQTVSNLIEEIGFAPYDTGNLHDSTRQEPGAPVYATNLTLAEARQKLA